MRRLSLALLVATMPRAAFAHDAFGDLGPFYGSLLHPLADPMQAALVLGTAAFLAGRSLDRVRVALPVFVVAAALAHLALGWGAGLVPAAVLPALAAVAVGGAATLPDRWTRASAGLGLVAVVGALTGLAPDRPPATGALQPILGTVLGIAFLTTLAWATLDTLARRISPIAPAVAGSWVAAVGLLASAFAFQTTGKDAQNLTATIDTASEERSDR